MIHIKKIIFFITLLSCLPSWAIQLKDFTDKPKLVVVIVVDQLRADYLLRWQNNFLPADKEGKVGGYNFLTQKSAYFPYASYDVLQNMTCPGHAMISTGSWPINTGIGMNEWFDRKRGKLNYCAFDEKEGLSPKALRTTTVSDEYKNIDSPSKVFAVALKDRSAIMLGGHRADMAIWMDRKSYVWTTSKYYQDGKSPTWLAPINAANVGKKIDEMTIAGKFGLEQTIKVSMEALDQEKLGQNKQTDFLMIDFSSNDILGHRYGPNSQMVKDHMTDGDKELSKLFNKIKSNLGSLNDVVFVLTSDHGIPPAPDALAGQKVYTGKINDIEVVKIISERLKKRFNLKDSVQWFSAMRYLHYSLNDTAIEKAGLDKKAVLLEMRAAIQEEVAGVEIVLIPSLFNTPEGALPLAKQLRSQIENSYVAGQWGDLVVVPKPFFMGADDNFVTHVTGYSYDRTVPIAIIGKKFKTGVYLQKALVVDIAPTLAASLGIVPPAKADGRVLYEIFK
jgi:predicted AlkP superfamily pyrophosphatase or phosphodiesterase